MALIIEDGSEVTGANSYVSVAVARSILAQYGQDLDVDNTIAEQQLLFGMSYVEQFRAQYTGTKKTREQSTQWPRYNAILDTWTIQSDEIPVELINSQVFAAYENSLGANLEANDSGRKIASEKVDSLQVSYFKSSATSTSVVYSRVMNELTRLLTSSNNLKLVRT